MTKQLETLVRTSSPPLVFVSYSHKDEKWKDALLPQLESLAKLGTVEVWDDRKIKAGTGTPRSRTFSAAPRSRSV